MLNTPSDEQQRVEYKDLCQDIEYSEIRFGCLCESTPQDLITLALVDCRL